MERESTRELVQKAIDVVGGQSILARAIGVKQQHVWNWLNRDKRVPARFVLLIEKATYEEVSRYELRPDVFKQQKQT